MTLFWVMAIEALLATAPAILLIPRARQSPLFDRVLWLATWLLAFLGAWNAPNYFPPDSALNTLRIANVEILPTMLGASVGALLVNGLLWVLDRLGGQIIDEEGTDEIQEQNQGENLDAIEQ